MGDGDGEDWGGERVVLYTVPGRCGVGLNITGVTDMSVASDGARRVSTAVKRDENLRSAIEWLYKVVNGSMRYCTPQQD